MATKEKCFVVSASIKVMAKDHAEAEKLVHEILSQDVVDPIVGVDTWDTEECDPEEI